MRIIYTRKWVENAMYQYREGLLHSTSGPAIIGRYKTGEVSYVSYQHSGETHREDGPAELFFNPHGALYHVCWQLRGKTHRDGGPAEIWYDTDQDTVSRASWHADGTFHREDGPAYVMYNTHGQLIHSMYYKDGEVVPPYPQVSR